MSLVMDSCVFIDGFQPSSHSHDMSLKLLRVLKERNILVTMPAHAWFEVQTTFQKLSGTQDFFEPDIFGNSYPIELIHIDDMFIKKYSMTDIPYIKGGDHIFLAYAYCNGAELVTNDKQMISVAKKINIAVYTPSEYLNKIESKSG